MYRVLIVDDEIFVRNLLKKNLESASFPISEIAIAEDGKEAMEKALSFKPDIMVTDISMPFMNGLELIEALQEKNIEMKTIIISGYDEFDYARKAINLGVTHYLLKPFLPKELLDIVEEIIQELDNQNVLKRNLQMLRTQAHKYQILNRKDILSSILAGNPVSEEERKQLFSETKNSYYLAGVLRVNGAIWDFHIQEQVEEFFHLIETEYFNSNLEIYGLGLKEDKLVICFHIKNYRQEQVIPEITKSLEKLSQSLKQYYDISLYCSLGQVYQNMIDLKISYQDALMVWKGDLQKNIWIFGRDVAPISKEIKEKKDVSDQIRDYKNFIRSAISMGKWKETEKHVQELMSCYALCSEKGTEYIFVSVGELLYAVDEDMDKLNLKNNLVIPELSHVISLLELREVIEEYFYECCQLVMENKSNRRLEKIVKLMQTYVQEHLQEENLSIETMESQFHFSSSYLRQIFKEVTGESFGEYVIQKRMEKAKHYLQTSSMKIQDVAKKCGYDNQRYFARSFKKIFGKTPTEFKQNIV